MYLSPLGLLKGKRLQSNDLRKECSTIQYHHATSSDCFYYNNERHGKTLNNCNDSLKTFLKEGWKAIMQRVGKKNEISILAFTLISCTSQQLCMDSTLKSKCVGAEIQSQGIKIPPALVSETHWTIQRPREGTVIPESLPMSIPCLQLVQ